MTISTWSFSIIIQVAQNEKEKNHVKIFSLSVTKTLKDFLSKSSMQKLNPSILVFAKSHRDFFSICQDTSC